MKINTDMNLITSPLTWNQDVSCLATHENVCSRSTGAMHKKRPHAGQRFPCA